MKKYVWIFILVFVIGFGIFLYKGTYSIDYENNDVVRNLNLKYDKDKLNNNFYNYIDLIDDSVISTSSFVMSDVLSENYDFLTVFAIDFILKHIDDYRSDIVTLDNYTYNDGYNDYKTNKYVSKDVIYGITNDVFGKKDYLIINEYLKLSYDMVPLLLIDKTDFAMELDEIVNVLQRGNNYEVSVKYRDNDLIYKYIFQQVDDRLILKNIEI